MEGKQNSRGFCTMRLVSQDWEERILMSEPVGNILNVFGFQKETLELSNKERKILFRDINDMEVNFRSVGKVIGNVSKIYK